MTSYYCKCGRMVRKNTNADNTGNRDTEGCEGCPYLMPWGFTKWDDTSHAFVPDVKGYECRMSKDIEYATRFSGSVQNKCACYIASLDFDFLEQVSRWIAETYPNREIFANFDHAQIRPVEYVSNGRYRMNIICAPNRKGIAAKAALLERFFNPDGSRKDMTPAQEKAHILDSIKKGREQAQGKDTTMKRQNDRCPLQQECERTCKVIGHERDCDYYVNNRYCTEGIPDQDELLAEEELRQQREQEERYLASLPDKPTEPVTYQNDYGTVFAVREKDGAPRLMCRAKGAAKSGSEALP